MLRRSRRGDRDDDDQIRGSVVHLVSGDDEGRAGPALLMTFDWIEIDEPDIAAEKGKRRSDGGRLWRLRRWLTRQAVRPLE